MLCTGVMVLGVVWAGACGQSGAGRGRSGDRRLLEAGMAYLGWRRFRTDLANAAHVKNVPGRKTDVSDADWLTDLLAHGLIRPSLVPDAPTQELRALLRTRKQLVREQSSHVLLVQKTLEDANIKLDSVISDIIGRSGRAMIKV